MDSKKNVLSTELRDQVTGHTLKIILKEVNGVLHICPEGYGDCCSNDGSGVPALIEYHNDRLRILGWTNINEEDCTDIIDLEGAKENFRQHD